MEEYKEKILLAVKKVTNKEDIVLEIPPKRELGDFAFPCFVLAKEFKKAPTQIAIDLVDEIKNSLNDSSISVKVIGPYINFFIDQNIIIKNTIKEIQEERENYAKNIKQKITTLIESPGPNTNKPLHLGHLRNILLGSSIANIMKHQGKNVKIVNVVNDRGVHICKSMLAYQMFGNNQLPEQAGRKSDHFVGDFYVKYSKEVEKNPELEDKAQELLLKWENNDPETIKLWNKMNKWALDGFDETYKKLNFSVEKNYLESDTYKGGRDIIKEGLDKGIFSKDDKGAIIIKLEDKNLGTKVLLRSNGTSVYITQDINMAKLRYDDFKFDEMIYVVGNEQEYHFKVLFEVFKSLKWSFADKCYHFSYGMVELPEGKMKSRQGNVIDTDDLIEQMTELAKEEVKKRYNNLSEDEINDRSFKIAMCAIRFFFLKFDPLRNFIFNPKESLSFEGETGPYVQYSYARICSIFRKLEEEKIGYSISDISKINFELLNTELDKKLASILQLFKEKLEEASKNLKPSIIARYVYELASTFNEYYRDNSIIKSETEELRNARLSLIDSTKIVIKSALDLLGIEVLEQM